MLSLFLDTHDKYVTVVIFKDGKCIYENSMESNNKHSVITLPSIRESLEKNQLNINDVNEVIVVNGPGSFTGVRIAVTIAKTIAYSLNIPIKTIDSLLIEAICVDDSEKLVSIVDRNGAFIGKFDKDNKLLEDYKYINKNEYEILENSNHIYSDVKIDYDKVYNYLKNIDSINPHSVKPLYVKGISALND